eukprot:snap_masked-scaffold_5-processed-gene-18.29-mRNA-1 protein AED:1.00 eAED:1.00 QI:0/-1/0/0/-1/1/1/0/565
MKLFFVFFWAKFLVCTKGIDALIAPDMIYIAPEAEVDNPFPIVEIFLPVTDDYGNLLVAEIVEFPDEQKGKLFQLSQVYDQHGYEPKYDEEGEPMSTQRIKRDHNGDLIGTEVKSKKNNLIFEPHPTFYTTSMIANSSFKYRLYDVTLGERRWSNIGKIKVLSNNFVCDLTDLEAEVVEGRMYWLENEAANINAQDQKLAEALEYQIELMNAGEIDREEIMTDETIQSALAEYKTIMEERGLWVGLRQQEDKELDLQVVVQHDFILNDEGWTVQQMNDFELRTYNTIEKENKNKMYKMKLPVHHDTMSNDLLTRYIQASDSVVDTIRHSDTYDPIRKPETERSLWHFVAPKSFFEFSETKLSAAYGGLLEFVVGAFQGEFHGNVSWNVPLHLVSLECGACDSGAGARLVYRFPKEELFDILTDYKIIRIPLFINTTENRPVSRYTEQEMFKPERKATFGLPKEPRQLIEGEDPFVHTWLKDTGDIQSPWVPATPCELVEVLSMLDEFKILGDYTSWYETIAIDVITIKARTVRFPEDATDGKRYLIQGIPDACYCTFPGLPCQYD